ncbi:MAG: hypothetical protein NTX80_01080 [Candidatus Saccharibacteria bacterium]|nr:hypothetical protein [Candidatus Saccharibacteria bacterium]
MRKHKRLVFGGAVVVVLVVSAFIGILVSRRYLKSAVHMPPGSIVHGSNTPNKSAAKVPVIETLKSFNEIQLSMTNKRWAEAVSQSMAYGESTDNPANYRITAYAYCQFSANAINDLLDAANCNTKGLALIDSLPKTEQELTKKAYEATIKGEKYIYPSNSKDVHG